MWRPWEIACAVTVVVSLALGACEREPAASTGRPGVGEDHGHEHAPGDGHAHEAEHGHEHDGGEKRELGAATAGAYEVRAAIYGVLTPGEEIDVDILLGDAAERPAAVRAWIGAEDARGSLKARAESEADHYHAHVEVPDPTPPDARLWVEIESAGGERSVGSFPLGG